MKSATLFVSVLFAAASLVCAAPAPAVPSRVARTSKPQTFFPDVMIQIKEAEPDHAFGDTDWGLVSRVSVQTLQLSFLILMRDIVLT